MFHESPFCYNPSESSTSGFTPSGATSHVQRMTSLYERAEAHPILTCYFRPFFARRDSCLLNPFVLRTLRCPRDLCATVPLASIALEDAEMLVPLPRGIKLEVDSPR